MSGRVRVENAAEPTPRPWTEEELEEREEEGEMEWEGLMGDMAQELGPGKRKGEGLGEKEGEK